MNSYRKFSEIRRRARAISSARLQNAASNDDGVGQQFFDGPEPNQSPPRPFLNGCSECNALRSVIAEQHGMIQELIQMFERKSDEGMQLLNENVHLQQRVEAGKRIQALTWILPRVTINARRLLEGDQQFRDQFASGSCVSAFVVSIDIRKSTELMLKARSPGNFADFITLLGKRCASVIKRHFGVVEKFTGDGILAYFPLSFSGEDAGILALQAAAKCIQVFDELYRTKRSYFSLVHADVGLGVGIDYGTIQQTLLFDSVAIVGMPVVYACRLSCAPAGQILLNQSAYDYLVEAGLPAEVELRESIVEIKGDGRVNCYQAAIKSSGISGMRSREWVLNGNNAEPESGQRESESTL